MTSRLPSVFYPLVFTFHYGQIYYANSKRIRNIQCRIYIPLWLDLLCETHTHARVIFSYLHSTMVRFIMPISGIVKAEFDIFTFHYGQIYYTGALQTKDNLYNIYIPLWLDLLWLSHYLQRQVFFHLHSTMVRFIMSPKCNFRYNLSSFTFHYGQIYYVDDIDCALPIVSIYIPLWLDLL